jgi:hypothetical protein
VIFLKRILAILLIFILVSIGVTGCMEDKEINTKEENPKDNTQSEIIADLQDQYGKKFKIVKVFEGGVTVGGKKVPTGYLIECLDDGTKFKYFLHDDGEIDNYYVNMKLGNDYYEDVLKEKFDKIYGENKYVCQILLYPANEPTTGEDLGKYSYKKDPTKQVSIFLGVEIENFNLEQESEKISNLYNGLEGFDMKKMQIGFFTKIPDDIEQFLVFETTGAKNTFDLFYLDALYGVTFLSSSFNGENLSPEDVEKLHLTKAELEEEQNGELN